MTDYKQLCGELLNRLNGLYEEIVDAGVGYVPDEAQDLMNRARAALAEPEPEGPTVMDIIELAEQIEAAGLGQVDLVRAALARWGNHNTSRSNLSHD